MNKKQLIDAVSNDTGFTKASIQMVVESMMRAVKTSVTNNERVMLVGFGTFAPKNCSARKATLMGTTYKIKASVKPTFVPTKSWKIKND